MDRFFDKIAEQGWVAIVSFIIAYGLFKYIFPAWGKHLKTKQAEVAVKAVAELNGKLVEAVRLALQQTIEESMRRIFDERFREMPEFMREKMVGFGLHGGNNALQKWTYDHHPIERIKNIEDWMAKHDGQSEDRNQSIHDLEMAMVEVKTMRVGQETIMAMIADVKKSIEVRNDRK